MFAKIVERARNVAGIVGVVTTRGYLKCTECAAAHGALVVTVVYRDSHDGLPLDAPAELWPLLHPVPEDIAEKYWASLGGHNSAGSEGPFLRDWAVANIKKLTRFNEGTCRRCEQRKPLELLHRHNGYEGYVCEDCWDERLRVTE